VDFTAGFVTRNESLDSVEMAVLDTRILLVPARCANEVDAENISPASGSKKILYCMIYRF